jgi:hypothetical protein
MKPAVSHGAREGFSPGAGASPRRAIMPPVGATWCEQPPNRLLKKVFPRCHDVSRSELSTYQ